MKLLIQSQNQNTGMQSLEVEKENVREGEKEQERRHTHTHTHTHRKTEGGERKMLSNNKIIEKRCLNPISGFWSIDPLLGVLCFS